jgi:hypothetical protein
VGLGACGRIGFDADGALDDGGPDLPVANRAFVTSTTQAPGSLGGAAGPDAICADRAREAGLVGHYVAYVSTTAQDARDHLGGARGWTRVDGRPVVDTVDDLIADGMIHPIRLDERGRDLGSDDTFLVATGTYAGGRNENCDDFSDPAANVMAGSQFFTGGAWANVNTEPCTIPARLYCFQIDLDVPLEITPATGRKAFVSSGTFLPSTGIATADGLCASDAASAGLAGTFLALLPTSTPAADRFDATGPGWIRVDGVPLAESATDFLAGSSSAPLDLEVDGSLASSVYVQTGLRLHSAFAVTDPGDTCDVWTNPASGSVVGYAFSTTEASLNITTYDCMTPQPVYCLER